jgi:MFS family permease
VVETNLDKTTLASDRDAFFLYAAAFLLAFGGGHWWLALPFVVNLFGGSDTQVGLCLAAYLGMYAFTVMLATPLLIHRNLKRILQVGTLGLTVSTLLMCLIVALEYYGCDLPHPVWLIILTSALFGFCLAGFWPPLMGWLSTGCLSYQLNRRLSLFGASWAVASFLYPYVAGRLVEINPVWPFAVAVGIMVICFLSVSIPAKPQATDQNLSQNSLAPTEKHPLLPCFRWMSRIALFACFLGFGISRTQFPIYFKENLGNKESIFGIFVTINAVAMFFNYLCVGRTHAWHYRFSLFLTAQIFLLLFQLTVIFCTHLYIYYFVAVLLGLGAAFCYSSHLYYGSAGGAKRYALMAIHEFILASGYVIGALGGGALNDYYKQQDPKHYNHLAPYKLGAAVLTLAILAQIILFLVYRSKRRHAKNHPESEPNPG